VQRDVRDDASTSRYVMGGVIDVEFFCLAGKRREKAREEKVVMW
jgi:hypothetical protein